MRASVPLVVVAILLCGAAMAPQPAAAQDAAFFQNLVEIDCNAQLHILSSSAASTNLNGKSLQLLINLAVRHLTNLAECACPDITHMELLRRFVPSVDMLLSVLDNTNDDLASDCDVGDFLTGFLDNSLDGRGSSRKLDASILPSSCSYEDYAAGAPCLGRVTTSVTDLELQFAAQKCVDPVTGADLNTPFISISCAGEFCEKFLNPCTTDADCGDDLTCQELFSPENFVQFLMDAGLIDDGDQLSSCGGSGSFLDSILAKLASYVPGLTAPTNTGLNVCAPPDQLMEDLGDDMAEQFGSDKSNLEDLAVDACLATGCPSLEAIGNGDCDLACNNADCKMDGNDCAIASDSKCPSDNELTVCSGHGYCDDDTEQCDCVWAWNKPGVDDCSECSDETPEMQDRCADMCNNFPYYDCAAPQVETVTSPAGKGILSWDGKMADGTVALSTDRKSGFAFSSAPIDVSSEVGTKLALHGGDQGFGMNLFNPRIGFAAKADSLQDMLNFVFTTIKDMQECRAASTGQAVLTHEQFEVRWMLYTRHVSAAYLFFAADSLFDLGSNTLSDWLPFRAGDEDFDDGFKLQVPDTMSVATWAASHINGFQYTYLSELFGADFVLQAQMKQSEDFPLGSINGGFTASGPVPDIIRNPTPCSSASDCASGLVCADFGGADFFNFDEVFTGANADPAGMLLWGDRNYKRECATTAHWRNAVRSFFLAMGGNPPDDSTSLQFCFVDLDTINDNAESWTENLFADSTCLEGDDDENGDGGDSAGDGGMRARALEEAKAAVDSVLAYVPARVREFSRKAFEGPTNKIGRTLRNLRELSVETTAKHNLRKLQVTCAEQPVVINGFEALPTGADLIAAKPSAGGGDPIDNNQDNDPTIAFVAASVVLDGLTAETFDDGKRAAFKESVAESLSTDSVLLTSDDVTITGVTELSEGDGSEAGSGAGRRARRLAAGIQVDFVVRVPAEEAEVMLAAMEDTETFGATLGQKLFQRGVITEEASQNLAANMSVAGLATADGTALDDSAPGVAVAAAAAFVAAAVAAALL